MPVDCDSKEANRFLAANYQTVSSLAFAQIASSLAATRSRYPCLLYQYKYEVISRYYLLECTKMDLFIGDIKNLALHDCYVFNGGGMSFANDSAGINGQNFSSNYIYSISVSSENASSVNGVSNYSGQVSGFGAAGLSGQITVLDSNMGTFSLGGVNYQIHGTTSDGNYLIFGPAGFPSSPSYVISNAGAPPTATLSYATANGYNKPSPACFCRGTMISTPGGERAVEAIRAGDLVMTVDGDAVEVVWAGYRAHDVASSPWPEAFAPVEISANAIADGVPSRALRISPNHSIAFDLVGRVLVPAHLLVNGTTIRQDPIDHIEYWHIELAQHDLVKANGAPTETYLDTGNRGQFAGEAGVVSLLPAAVQSHPGYCATIVFDGPILEVIRSQLAKRASPAWLLSHRAAEISLVVDSVEMPAHRKDNIIRFVLPASAKSAQLISDTFVPAYVDPASQDRRTLGVRVGSISIDDGLSCRREIDVMDERLTNGFYGGEAGTNARWTNGAAILPKELWAGAEDVFFLRITLVAEADQFWDRNEGDAWQARVA